MNNFIPFMVFGIVVASLGLPANSAVLPAPQQVSEHVYAWIGPHGGPDKKNQGYRMNMAFVVGKNAVAVIETGYTEAMAKEMLQHISKITSAPVKYAISSNSQPDRTMGNEAFRRAGAEVLMHAKEAERFAANAPQYANSIASTLGFSAGSVTVPKAPDRLITDSTEIDLGGIKLLIKPFRASHTLGSLVVHIPADNVVYAGDILYSGRLLAILPDSSIKNWIAAFDELKPFGGATFIPGHGKPAKLKAFEFPTRTYLVTLNEHMKKMMEGGIPLQEAIHRLNQTPFSKLANFEELAGRNANLAYLEQEKEFFGQ